jgi:hypothetical protein
MEVPESKRSGRSQLFWICGKVHRRRSCSGQCFEFQNFEDLKLNFFIYFYLKLLYGKHFLFLFLHNQLQFKEQKMIIHH